MSVILSDLIAAIDRLGTTAAPIEMATAQERDDLVTLLRSLEVLLPIAQAGLAWRSSIGSAFAQADRVALLEALAKIQP